MLIVEVAAFLKELFRIITSWFSFKGGGVAEGGDSHLEDNILFTFSIIAKNQYIYMIKRLI